MARCPPFGLHRRRNRPLVQEGNVGHRDLLPEEYDLFDLRTVDKAVESPAAPPRTQGAWLGRQHAAPDFTVGAVAPAGADPYNASLGGFAIGNGGNTVPQMNPITGAWYRLFGPMPVAGRAGLGHRARSIAPVIKYPYYGEVIVGGVEQLVPLMGTPDYRGSRSIRPSRRERRRGRSGHHRWQQAALDTVVGNGQLIGRYTGPGLLRTSTPTDADFIPTVGRATTSDAARFDPDLISPSSPYVATGQPPVRSRLPYNDYFARTPPRLGGLQHGQPIGLQAMWMTDSIGGGTSPQAPVNVVAASATTAPPQPASALRLAAGSPPAGSTGASQERPGDLRR